jgi:hypothetical protein
VLRPVAGTRSGGGPAERHACVDGGRRRRRTARARQPVELGFERLEEAADGYDR